MQTALCHCITASCNGLTVTLMTWSLSGYVIFIVATTNPVCRHEKNSKTASILKMHNRSAQRGWKSTTIWGSDHESCSRVDRRRNAWWSRVSPCAGDWLKSVNISLQSRFNQVSTIIETLGWEQLSRSNAINDKRYSIEKSASPRVSPHQL